jgi:peptidoglycan hydrolase CwlO-like protein
MQSRQTTLLASLLVTGLMTLGIACSDDDNGGDTITSTPDTRTTSGATSIQPPANSEANDREEFITTIEARLQQLETQIEDLEAEAGTMTGDAQAEAQARLDDLKVTMAGLESELAQLESVSGADFEALKSDIEEQVDNAMTEAQALADELGI